MEKRPSLLGGLAWWTVRQIFITAFDISVYILFVAMATSTLYSPNVESHTNRPAQLFKATDSSHSVIVTLISHRLT